MTLFFTAEEQVMFDALSHELTDGWDVKIEIIKYKDTPQLMQVRMRNMTLKDPQLLVLKGKLNDMNDIQTLANTVEIASVDEEDLMELYYALGPDVLTHFISEGLAHVQSKHDIDAIHSLSVVRNVLLSLCPIPQ